MNIRIVLLAVTFPLFIAACGEKEDPEIPFDKGPLLASYANNLIVPAYATFEEKSEALHAAAESFATNPTTAGLELLKTAYHGAALQWMATSMYELGPAADISLRANINTFPTDTALIAVNISNGTWDLSAAANMDAKGLPALDFLLFGKASAEVVQQFISQQKRRDYLLDLTEEIATLARSVHHQWNVGGYDATFRASSGSDAGSSLSLLVNQMNFDLEITKNNRFAIPLGKRTLGVALPEKVEAYYSGYSLEFAAAHIEALHRLFLGNFSGTDGPGIDDYLDHLQKNSSALLSPDIHTHFKKTIASIQAVPGPLSATSANNPGAAETAYVNLQRLVVLLKTDMPSALGIMITYQDNDGD